MPQNIEIPTDPISRRVLKILIAETERVLKEKKKVVTKTTIDSLTGETKETDTRAIITMLANESLQFIIQGRKKGAKYPGRVVNGKFEVFDELKKWKEVTGFEGSDFILAKTISEKGIKPVAIMFEVLANVEQQVYAVIQQEWNIEVSNDVVEDLIQSFRGL